MSAPDPPAAPARSTLRSSFAISVAVMSSRVLGVARDAIFLALWPVGVLTDAYRVAFQIPNLLRDLFAEGALSSAFVPTFTEALTKDGKARAYQLGNLVLTAVLIVTALLTVLGILFSETVVGLISGGFAGDADKLALTASLSNVMMPILMLVSASAVFMGMCNAQSRFVAPAFAPALFNVTSIGFGAALWFAGSSDRSGLMLFAVGTLVAAGVQAAVQLPTLWSLGYRPGLAMAGLWRDPGVRRIAGLMAPAVIGLAAVQVNIFINTRFASSLGDGPVTYLGNAFRIFYLPIGLFGVALATVTTTAVATQAARGDRAALIGRTSEGLRGVWLLGSASAVGLFALAEEVVALLFERGVFSRADTQATAAVLRMYILGVVPYSLVKNLVPAFYAIGRPRIPMAASMAAVAVNIVFSSLTYRQLGAPGLALGTTLGAVANWLVLRVSYGAIVGSLATPGWPRHALALVFGNGALAAAVFALARFGPSAARSLALPVPDGGGGLWGGGFLFATIAAGFALYAGVMAMLGYPGASGLLSLPAKLWRRVRRGRQR